MPVLQAIKLREGDLVISLVGTGGVISAYPTQLCFKTSDVVTVVNISTGPKVGEGDILASLANSTQQASFTRAEAIIESKFWPSGVAIYQLELAGAQISYNKALGEFHTYFTQNG